jgi:lipoprotein-anchoring transpeptidase ErfK/SrfK
MGQKALILRYVSVTILRTEYSLSPDQKGMLMQIIARRTGHASLLALLLALAMLLLPGSTAPQVHAQNMHASAHSNVQQSQESGKVIVVNLAHQWLYAYNNGVEVFNAPVMTGRPSLPTPAGTYRVFAKESPATFTSPFPRGSSDWYPPTHINYALEWKPGYFLHDSWWHSVYGPGTNVWHHDPVDGWQWGSHGCVAMSLRSAAWLYHWAPVGTVVHIVG